MSDLEIHTMLVLSTAHISEDVANSLPRSHTDMDSKDDLPEWAPTFTREPGWVFYVDHNYNNAPDSLKQVIAFAKALGCVWLMLDNDGPEVDFLPTFDW